MAADTFTPKELKQIAELATWVGEFNKGYGEGRLYAQVEFYRNGDHVASLTGDGPNDGYSNNDMVFDVKDSTS